MKKIENDLEMGFMMLHLLNPGKCHCIVISDNDPSHKIIFDNNKIANLNEKKSLDTLLDSKLNFVCQITSLCKKAEAKNVVLLQE